MAVAGFILGLVALICMIVGVFQGASIASIAKDYADGRISGSVFDSQGQSLLAVGMIVLITAIVVGIAAIIISAISMKKPGKKTLKVLGLVFGIVSVAGSSIILIACVACASAAANL